MNIGPTSFQQATLYSSYQRTGATRSARSQPIDNFDKRTFVRDLDAFSAFFDRLSKSLSENINVKKINELTHAKAISSEKLELSEYSLPATLNSTEAINTKGENSFSPIQPVFSGGSTATSTVSGTYDGSIGDDSLTITVTQAGNVGGPNTGGSQGLLPADLELEVRSSDGTLVNTISFSESDPENTSYELAFGLSLQLSGGSLELGDSLTVSLVQGDVETADPDGKMKLLGTGGSDANFDTGFSVINGSFLINGVVINVDKNQSINDTLTQITDSEAGVTASYNAETDRIELVQKTSGSAGQITFGNDTSGFLDAVKLTGGIVEPGIDSALDAKIEDVSEFSSIESGSILVNGVAVTIDVVNDSLRDVMNRINESNADVAATFSGGYMTLESTSVVSGLNLYSNGTNFFDVFSVREGTYKGENKRAIRGLRAGGDIIRKQFGKLDDKLTELLLAGRNSKTSSEANSLRGGLKSSVLAALMNTLKLSASDVESNGVIDTKMGIKFDFSESADSVVVIDYNDLIESLRKDPKSLVKFLFQKEGDQKESGLLESMANLLDDSKRRFANALGANSGLTLDVFA